MNPRTGQDKVSSRYLGLYANKAVRYLGEVGETVIVHGDGDEIVFDREDLSEEQEHRIRLAIKHGTEVFGEFIGEPHRIYLVDFKPTQFEKATKQGIWGPRVFHMRELLGDDWNVRLTTSSEVAQLLRGKTSK